MKNIITQKFQAILFFNFFVIVILSSDQVCFAQPTLKANDEGESIKQFKSSENPYETNFWTRFRGADGSGIDTSWKDPLSLDSTRVKWEIDLLGMGNASPVVWGSKIFVTSSDDSTGKGYLFGIDDSHGTVLWQKEFEVPEIKLHVDNKLAASTPAVDHSHVYVAWFSKEKSSLLAFSHEGIQKWEAQFDGVIARHGGGNSLMLTDKYVVFTREQEDFSTMTGSWIALEKKTGKVAWELERESARANSFSTPFLYKKADQSAQLIFASQAHGLTSIDPGTGKVIWEKKGLLSARVVASPIHSAGYLVACCKGEAVIYDMNPPIDQLADTAKYHLPRSLSPYVPTPIIVGEHLFTFLDNGSVACILLETGELLWKERPAGPIYGSPICIGKNLYCLTKTGEIIVMRAQPTYDLVAVHELDEGSFSTPAMSSKGMIIRTFTKMRLYGNE